MSELTSLTREVEGLLAEIGKLSRPAQEARQVIGRALGTLDVNARDPELRRAALRQQDQLARADRILAQAMQSCGQSVQTGQQWLAQHAARGGGGGGAVEQAIGAAAVGGATGTLASRAGALSGASSAAKALANAADSAPAVASGAARGGTLAERYAALAERNGIDLKTLDGYVFGGLTSTVVGAASPFLSQNGHDLVLALGIATLPPPAGALAAAGISVASKLAIKKGAARGTDSKDAGAFKSPIGQLWKLASERKTDWTATEWAAETVNIAVPSAIAAALVVVHAPILASAAASAGLGFAGWTLVARAHRNANHVPEFT